MKKTSCEKRELSYKILINKLLFIILIIFSSLSIGGCNQKATQSSQKSTVYIVKKKPWQQMLYFSVPIKPLHTKAIMVPADGIITKELSSPGQWVNKGQLLCVINTDIVSKDFQSALTSYLKSKNSLLDARQKKDNNELLYKNDIISRLEYQQTLEAYHGAQFNALEAMQKLQKITKILAANSQSSELLSKIDQLDMSHPEKVEKLLNEMSNMNQFSIHAPISGVLLFSNNNGDSSSATSRVGKSVKKNAVLAKIATKDGIKTTIYVNGQDIRKIHDNQPVIITTATLAGIQLKGRITSIAMDAVNQRMSTKFPVTITATNLDDKIKKQLLFGVNAKITITIKSKPSLIIPINMIDFNDNQNLVYLLKDNKRQKTLIQIGASFGKFVVVTSGLNEGDKIVTPTN